MHCLAMRINLFIYMSRIKKAARLLALICIMLLAGIGIGLSGGVPLALSNIRRESEKEKIELIENQERRSDFHLAEIKG